MTGFGDVNVGDKVRATSKVIDGLSVTGTANSADAQTVEIHGYGWLHPAGWSVEVLEPAPKPLPTEPGYYIAADDEPVYTEGVPTYRLSRKFGWRDAPVAGNSIPPWKVPRDLVRLVPESAVEEARAKVVKEIVELLRTSAWAGGSIDLAVSKVILEFGGKA